MAGIDYFDIASATQDTMVLIAESALQPGNMVAVRNQPGTGITSGPAGITVQSITLEKQSLLSVFHYVVTVVGSGPDQKGSVRMMFTDRSGDTYNLEIESSIVSPHTVKYNSFKPEIVRIEVKFDFPRFDPSMFA